MSSAAAAAHEYGAPDDDHQHLLHHHHQQQQQIMYHVPQYSRREKLQFPHEDPYYSQNTAPHGYYTAGAASTFDPLLTISNGNPSNYYHPQLPQPFTLTLSSPSAAPTAASALHTVQLGPFTGYATVLSRSRYLDPARQLLEEITRGAGGRAGLVPSSSCADLSEENLAMEHQILGAVAAVGEQQQWRKTRLISMLDEVYRRYKQYFQQVQTVISLFESVPGLSNAAPCASMALKVISKQFRYLKNVISEQLHHINKTNGKEGFGMFNGEISTHKSANDFGTIKQPHVWRPQRGLPERAVAVLRAWLFEHFLHPYPTDADKQMLAKQTGLMRNQVSNWFINARVRLWKPMVEEVHSLEFGQQNNITDADDSPNVSDKYAKLPPASTATASNELPLKNQSSKRPRDDLTQMTNNIGEPYNLIYDGIAIHRPVEENVVVRGNGDVSLTLGLHQHNGVYLTEPLPISVREFGLGVEECNDAYVIGSLEGQGRNFEKYIDGHYLHDFVG
ncbi:BEL1-like homeodomain protein 9 [Iris pallida]|uniref:BEL1-like homeodomain protein 9 n=1 Tax=Iris pallida TaxID=29817 RepID=A0AAX6E6H9_IRIPA|nr:BEL1-like homeodomain protein 9 [Iris pallida]